MKEIIFNSILYILQINSLIPNKIRKKKKKI